MKSIPTLIFIDGKTGQLINRHGRTAVTSDPMGEQFPWRPTPFSDVIVDVKFIDRDEKETSWDQLHGKIIGLFFSVRDNRL